MLCTIYSFVAFPVSRLGKTTINMVINEMHHLFLGDLSFVLILEKYLSLFDGHDILFCKSGVVKKGPCSSPPVLSGKWSAPPVESHFQECI